MKRGKDLVMRAMIVFRQLEQEELEKQARVEAEKERKQLLAKQEREAKALERKAKKATSAQAKTVLNDMASQVREQEVESVDAAVGTVLEEQQAGWRGAGVAKTKDYWSAEVTNAALLPRAYLMPDLAKLNELARKTEGEDLGIKGAVGVKDTRVTRS